MAINSSSSKQPVPQIVRVTVVKRDAAGNVIDTKTVEVPRGDN